MTLNELVYEQIKALPAPQAKEVLDFIGFLKVKQERAEWTDLISAQSTGLNAIWDNLEDEVWNDL